MPAEQVDAMVNGAPPIRQPGRRNPLVTLLRELQRRPEVTYFSLTKGETSVLWRRG